MRQAVLHLTVLTYLGFSPPAFAGDANQGERLSRRWCAACHVVAADQVQANADAPSFAAIAARRDLDPAKLAFLLLTPHPVMPELALRRTEADDIVAYIVKLRSLRGAPRAAPK